MSPFTEEAKKFLFEGKYSDWAKDINIETLHCLFWFVGEFSSRSDIREYIHFGEANNLRDERRDIAVETIIRIQRGERFSGDPIQAPRDVFREAMKRRYASTPDSNHE